MEIIQLTERISMPMTVKLAYFRDNDRCVTRIDPQIMEKLNISPGDNVEICGDQKSYSTCLPLFPKDDGKKIIRIDRFARNHSKIKINSQVRIKKIKLVKAKLVKIQTSLKIPVNDSFISDILENFCVQKNQIINISYFDKKLKIKILETLPKDVAVKIDSNTQFEIKTSNSYH